MITIIIIVGVVVVINKSDRRPFTCVPIFTVTNTNHEVV